MQPRSRLPTCLLVLPWSLAGIGGVNQVVKNLAREAYRAGEFDPLVLVADWDAPLPVWEEIDGIRTVRWRIRGCQGSMSLKEKVAYFFWRLRFRPAFKRFCDQQQIAVINVHYPAASAITIERIARTLEKPVPLVFSFHGADLTSIIAAPEPEVARWRRCLIRARGVVVCSQDLGYKFLAAFGDVRPPLVIHNGLDAPAFVAMASELPPPTHRHILNVAKFEHKKGQDVLLKAFAEIASEYADTRLVLVGSSDAALPDLRSLCKTLAIEHRVDFFPDTPHRSVADFFGAATIFALPSRQEPFGIVLLEAGSFGLPVVASRIGGIPEIISDGIEGRLVTPDRPAELALGLRSLLDRPVDAKEMGRRLRQRVTSEFTWESAYRKYADLLLGRGSG